MNASVTMRQAGQSSTVVIRGAHTCIHFFGTLCVCVCVYIYIYIYISADLRIKSFWYNCILKLCGGAYGKYTFWVSNHMVGSTTKIATDIGFSNKGQSCRRGKKSSGLSVTQIVLLSCYF
jgi:hypothetical protein